MSTVPARLVLCLTLMLALLLSCLQTNLATLATAQ